MCILDFLYLSEFWKKRNLFEENATFTGKPGASRYAVAKKTKL